MGKGWGVLFLVIGLFIVYMQITGSVEFSDMYSIYGVNYGFIIGVIFFIVGLWMLLFSKLKSSRY